MSDVGEAAFESVLTRGDASPRAMETLVQALVIGKSTSSTSASYSSSSDDSTTDTTSSSGDPTNPRSNQIQGDPFETQARGEFVPPRFSPDVWAAAMEQSTRLGRCIRTYARNTVGLGWFIEPIQKIDPNSPNHREHLLKVKAQTALLHRLFDKPSRLIPTTELFYMAKVDEEATGNGYMEVVRNNAGHIVGLYHAPAVSVRVRVKKEESGAQLIGGYVQLRGNEKRYFKEFGDETVMNALTGEVHSGGQALPVNERATEILHFKLYSPTSTWYGAPRYVSAAPALSGNRLASVRNVKFFENDAVPRMALLVSGGRLTPDSINSIEDFFKAKVQGTEKAHSVVVIQTEQTKIGFSQQQDNVRLDLKPLTVGVTEDASFSQYRSANDDEIRESFGIPPVFFSTESVNKACLVGDTRIPLLDGRTRTFVELTEEYKNGETFWVFSADESGNVVPGLAHSPRMTKNAEIWEALLDNGEVIRGTDDHLCMLLDGNYRQLSSLCPGDRLKPLYRAIRPIARAEAPYWWYSTNGMKKMDAVHRMVGKFINGGTKPTKDVHHKANSLDNRPEVLELLDRSSHMEKSCAIRWADASFAEKKQITDLGLKCRKMHESIEDLKREAVKSSTWRSMANKFGVHQDTIINRLVELGVNPTEFRNTLFVKHVKVWRADVTLERILEEAPKYKSIHAVAKALKSSTSRIMRVLKSSGKDWQWVKREFLGVCVGTGENHRVISVRKTGETLPVYDLTVETHHNFALHCGVFVHNSAQTSREICNEQEFEPDRLVKENMINLTIVADVLREDPVVRFRFERMKLTDPLDTARMDQTYASLGALTPNELRESLGKPRYPQIFNFGDKPMQVAMAELSMQLAEAIVGEFKTQIEHQKEQAKANQPPPPPGMPGMGGEGGDVPPEGGDGMAAGGEDDVGAGEAGAEGDAGAENAEWGYDGSTDESSPVTEGTPKDSHTRNIHTALGLSKSAQFSKMPIDTLLGMATELMKEARDFSNHSHIGNKEEDV